MQSFKSAKKFGSANRKNIGYANRKSANCHICRRSANVTNFVSPQICGFAICGPPTQHQWYRWESLPPLSLITVANFQLVLLIPVVYLDLRISLHILEKILNDSNIIFRGLGEDDSWKKYHDTLPLKQNISAHKNALISLHKTV